MKQSIRNGELLGYLPVHLIGLRFRSVLQSLALHKCTVVFVDTLQHQILKQNSKLMNCAEEKSSQCKNAIDCATEPHELLSPTVHGRISWTSAALKRVNSLVNIFILSPSHRLVIPNLPWRTTYNVLSSRSVDMHTTYPNYFNLSWHIA